LPRSFGGWLEELPDIGYISVYALTVSGGGLEIKKNVTEEREISTQELRRRSPLIISG
jgi:hypothetical protein